MLTISFIKTPIVPMEFTAATYRFAAQSKVSNALKHSMESFIESVKSGHYLRKMELYELIEFLAKIQCAIQFLFENDLKNLLLPILELQSFSDEELLVEKDGMYPIINAMILIVPPSALGIFFPQDFMPVLQNQHFRTLFMDYCYNVGSLAHTPHSFEYIKQSSNKFDIFTVMAQKMSMSGLDEFKNIQTCDIESFAGLNPDLLHLYFYGGISATKGLRQNVNYALLKIC